VLFLDNDPGGTGYMFWTSDGTDPNGHLHGQTGDICLGGPSGQPSYCVTGTTWIGMGPGTPGLASTAIYWFLNNVAVGSGGTVYAGAAGGSSSSGAVQTPFPSSGTIRHLYVGTISAQPATGNLVITMQKNGIDTAMVITITAGSGAGYYSDPTHSFTVSFGDTLQIKMVNAATSTCAGAEYLAFQLTP
jgi:hypothetical protein